MKLTNVYYMVLARSLDVMACSWIWRDYDITISSMCGLALRKLAPPLWARVLGWVLNHLQTGHCEQAIAADIQRCQQALAILQPTASSLT